MVRNSYIKPSYCMIYNDYLGRADAMAKVIKSFERLDDFVHDFAWSLHQKDTFFCSEVKQWRSVTLVSSL